MSNGYPYPIYPQAPGQALPGQQQGQYRTQDPVPGPGAYQVHAQGQAQPGMGQGYGPAGYGPAYPPGPVQGAYYPGYDGYPGAYYQAQSQTPFFNFANDRFLKGLLIGAAAAYLLTNETVQRTAIKGAVRAWSMLQGGVEEIKERFQDAEAEIRAAESAAPGTAGE